MPKLTEISKVTSISSHDTFIKDGVNGPKKIEINDAISTSKDVTDLKNTVFALVDTKTATGPIVNFLDGADSTELIHMEVLVGPDQSGSGDPSSENIRPFVAWEKRTIQITPRNLFRLRSSSSKVSGITVTPNADGTVNFSGTATETGGPIAAYVYLIEGIKYYCVFDYLASNYYPRLDGPNGERIYPTSGMTFTAPSSGEYTIRIVVNTGKTYEKSGLIPYICLDSSSHTKIPATGVAKGLPISTEDPVYAGILEYDKGGNYTFKAYPYYASYNGETLSGKWVSSMDVYAENTTPTTGAEVIDLSGTIAETYTYTGDIITIFNGENVICGNMKYGYPMSVSYIANDTLADGYDIPDYFRADKYMDNKIADIRAAILASGGDYDSFIFITDVHWGSNAQNSPALIKYILDRIPIPRVFFGGDMGEGINLTCLHAYREKITSKIYNVIGNHEYHNNYYDIGKPSVSMTMKDPYLWAYFNSGMTDAVVGNAGRNYYYVDNVVQKMRYIVLNVYAEGTTATFENDQQDWLANTALDLPEGYTAVILGHQIAFANHSTGALNFSYGAAGTAIRDIVDAASGTAEIACVLCGHTHFDGVGTTPGGTPVIVTTCDKYKVAYDSGGEPYDGWLADTRAKGTISEQAFDVFVIDKTNKLITAVRIGCPADNPTGDPLEKRTIAYGAQ